MNVDQNQVIMSIADNVEKIKSMQLAEVPKLEATLDSFATSMNESLRTLMDFQRGQFLMQRAQLLTSVAALTQDPKEREEMMQQARNILTSTAYLDVINKKNNNELDSSFIL